MSVPVTVAMKFRRQTTQLALLGNGRTTESLVIILCITGLIQHVYNSKGKVHPSTGHQGPEGR